MEEIPSRYDPKEIEPAIYKMWEESGYFNPDICVEKGVAKKDAGQFSIVLPPPNVTGTLHIGHAFEDTLQDIMVRVKRMQGKKTLWVPGTDHAAIATEARVAKAIAKDEKKSKHDLGREEFLRRVNEFAKNSRDTIVRQVKRMGASLDWSREAYTLDESRQLAVRTAFQKMYDLGLIYRGNRVVNWDPKGQTVISDAEVLHEERKAKFYTFRYSKDFPISISTTRPETKVGDTAVAVHPDDARYKKFAGKEYDIDFVGVPLHIKIIADDSVEKDFGTGALGVTPAHSMADFEMAERHKLPMIQVIDERAKMTVEGPLKSMKTEAAREWIVEELRKRGLVEKEEEIPQNVSISERTGAIVEPLPKLQWFIAAKKPFTMPHSEIKGIKSGEEITLQELMRRVVELGETTITPERFEKVYFHWIENLKDWCISRQLWFGHRIPVWYCMGCGEPHINLKTKSHWFLVRHGETDGNKELRLHGSTDTPLNETGRMQAKKVAQTFTSRNIDLIISSPLLRAKETAEHIAAVTGAEIIFESRLKERHQGVTEGMLRKEAEEKFGNLYAYKATIPEAEGYEDVELRAWEALAHHKKGHNHKNVVIVTHGGVMRMLQKGFRNLTPEAALAQGPVKNTEVFEIEIAAHCKKCGGEFYEQDPDTLDTWFSSGMWTFSTLGWPEKTADLKTYHPNSLMDPGYEILFLWVARMILMSGVLLGQVPFRKVLIHGIVRDSKGQKFSKSAGNGVDPIEIADKYGADALRMALVVGAAPGNDVVFDEQKVKGYRNFSTKLWNIARFVLMNKPAGGGAMTDKQIANRTELAEIETLKEEVTNHIESFEFHLAAEKIYHYIWHVLADRIVEQEKPKLRDGTDAEKTESYALLAHLFTESLKMLHPFMPFVTEELYGKFRPGRMLMVERW